MAAAIDITHRTYQSYEQGRTEPKASALFELARLGCNLQWLLTGQGTMLAADEPCPPPTSKPAPASVDAQLMGRIVDAVRGLYKAEGVGIADIQVGRLAADWYNHVVAEAPDDLVGQGMALARKVEDHRAQLRRDAADPGNAKRQA
jgi:hypothetical protein